MVIVVFDVVWCSWVGVFDFNWFIGVFMFFGLIGVGKIELVKVLVDFLFDDEWVMVCIDMSEYGEKYIVVWLIGVLFGYVGYEVGG